MVVSNVQVSNWRQSVEVVGEILVKNNKVDRAFIKSMIEVVEEFGPYMILIPEVAFFHGRPGSNVYEPCLSLAVLAEPVYFSEFENQKITCAFGFGAIDNESHLKMLIEISDLLQDQKFIDLITNNGSKEEILEVIRNIEEKNYDTK
jgi:PTS system ascorbate-specific IIA component